MGRDTNNKTPLATPLSRRAFLVGAGTVAATAVASSVTAKKTPRVDHGAVDAVVVGAGFAGLCAASQLEQRGVSVHVLEARGRVGGRTLNVSLGGGKVIEIGGQWVGPTQTRILALAASAKVKTFPTYDTGSNVLHYRGTLTQYPSTELPPLPSADWKEFETVVLGTLDTLAQQVPLDRPWQAKDIDVRALDGQTVETWKLKNLATSGARFLLDLFVEAVFACEPRDLSLLYFLFYMHSGGGFRPLISTGGGAQDARFIGGSQLVAERVAAGLRRPVQLGTAVRRIRHDTAGVVVETDRQRIRAARVIVALPPTLCGRIDFDPPLPALRDQLMQRVPQGSVIKCEAVYSGPFWRDAGLTGQAFSDTGPVKVTFDNSPPDGVPGVLLGFIEADEARSWGARTASERQQAVLESFARYFGSAALTPTGYFEHDWSADQWTRGCYSGFMPPGVLSVYGPALRPPIGRIHWAGTETAEIWNGYIDGAVRSGERAAAEILSA